MRSRVRTGLLVAIGVLYVFSVPWYRESGAEVGFVLGLPDWVAVALACYVAVAVLNSFAWLLADMPEESESAAETSATDGDASQREGGAR